MDASTKPRQPLLNIGSQTRDALEALAQADGMRWQDLARMILKNYVHGKQLEAVALAVAK